MKDIDDPTFYQMITLELTSEADLAFSLEDNFIFKLQINAISAVVIAQSDSSIGEVDLEGVNEFF